MNILVLAFDGLSSKDIEEQSFFLNQFQNDDMEVVDDINLGDRKYYFTSELFTDLITGKDYTSHEVRGLEKYTEGKYGINPSNFEEWLQGNLQPLFINGLDLWKFNFFDRSQRNGLYQFLFDSHLVKWERSDIKAITLFEEFPDQAGQGQLPTYNWRKADVFHHLKGEDRQVQKCVEHIEDEWLRSQRKFWSNFDQVEWGSEDNQLYIHHFHYIDWLQHIYRSDETEDGMEELQDPWWKVNEFVEEVKEELPEDTVLVTMSDHGLPQQYLGHLPNAYVGATKDIFPSNPSLQEMYHVFKDVLYGTEDPEKLKNAARVRTEEEDIVYLDY